MKRLILIVAGIFVFGACQKAAHKSDQQGQKGQTNSKSFINGGSVIRYDYSSGDISEICKKSMKRADERLDEMLKVPDKEKNFDNTIAAFEEITSDLIEETTPSTFMFAVHTKKSIRAESEKCEADLGQYLVGLSTRRDIYDAAVRADKQTPKKKLDAEQKRLVEQMMKGFKENGLFLPDDKLARLKDLKQQLTKLETQFAANLNENTDYVELTKEELEGVPESVMQRFQKVSDNLYKVTTKPTDYVQLMENAKKSETRKKMQTKYENRAAEANTKLLKEAVVLRQEIAKLLGFKTWADYRTQNRMAKNSDKVLGFLKSLRGKLAERNKEDLNKLLKLKKEADPKAKSLDPWDGTYLAYQLKKRDYSLDDEVIREYFPAAHVVEEMFDVYSKILGVKFVEVKNADVWANHVNLYEIRNKDDSFVAHFFTDFVPREGKYGHAAAFTLRAGRMVDGKYRTPISAIVANFTPPAGGKPSLLNHGEVETLFHEFGHIMHQTLTKSKYASLSGSNVARDFVEAPSQMLENWVWSTEILKKLSGHYKKLSKKIPDDLIAKMIEARHFNQGYFYTRQLLFGLFDMEIHTSGKDVDPTAIYKKLYKELTSIKPLEETHFPASFGHMMGGYDAGYYGYLWSEVFAQDMFTKFEQTSLLDSKVGQAYRKNILEKGDNQSADRLLTSFLGRQPSNKAFFKLLGVK